MVKNTSGINLTIVVPTFNEEDGIKQAIINIFEDAKKDSLKNLINSFEVIAVDDGSLDNTPNILKHLILRYKNLKVIRHRENLGLGASITTGTKHATKEFITYLPADGQAYLRDISEGLKIAPCAWLTLTYRGGRHDYNTYRHLLSNALTIAMKIFFGLNYKDYNWVHIYNRKLFDHIKPRSKGVFYLGEVVARTHSGGFKILEAEAKYHPRSTGYSKNARVQVVIKTLIDLLKLWVELKVKAYV